MYILRNFTITFLQSSCGLPLLHFGLACPHYHTVRRKTQFFIWKFNGVQLQLILNNVKGHVMHWAWNFTKSSTHPWMFFKYFKLYKWYQIAQSVSYTAFLIPSVFVVSAYLALSIEKILILTLPIPIPETEKNLWSWIFIFTLPCSALKGFMKVFKAFMKPFEAPQRSRR